VIVNDSDPPKFFPLVIHFHWSESESVSGVFVSVLDVPLSSTVVVTELTADPSLKLSSHLRNVALIWLNSLVVIYAVSVVYESPKN